MKTLWLSGCALLVLATPAIGQTTAPTPAPAPAEAPATTEVGTETPASDEIIVRGQYTLPDRIDTATGLGLTVRETPQSVSIVTAQRILDQNLISVRDVIENGVGVAVNESDDVRNSFFARGFEIQNTQIDGVPTAWALGGDRGETIADVSIYERVEIVRGATGLLSGAGDPSASINLVRKHADRTEWGGYLNAAYGSWDTWRVSGDVGGAVVPNGTLRVRAVGRYEEGNAFTDFYSNRKLVLYGTLEGDITDDTLLRVGFSHQRNVPKGAFWGSLPTFYSDGSIAEWDRSKSTAQPWTTWTTQNQNFFTTLRHDFGGGWSLTGNYNRLRNTQYTRILYLFGNVDRATGLGLGSNPYSADGESIQDSYDAQLKGKLTLFGRDHELVVGYLNSVINRHTDTYAALNEIPPLGFFQFPTAGDFLNWNENSYPDPGFSDTPTVGVEQERIRQIGYYGALRVNVADWLKVIGGGRIANWRQTGVAYGTARDYGDSGVFIPYVGALADLTPNHRLYASYTTIFQPQSVQDRNFDQLDPVQGKAYEVGLKSAFFGEALQTSVALFRIEQDNLGQIDGAPITRPGTGLPFQPYRAADGVVSEGFEIEATGSPLPNWNVNVGYSQFRARDAGGNDANTDQPRRLLKAFTTYTLPTVLNGLTLGGGANYRSSAYSDGTIPGTTPAVPFRFEQGGFLLVNLMTRLAVNDRVSVQANVDNLLDKTYFSQVGSFSQYRYGRPRSFTVSANYRF
ncbi:TonB-dependent siderophore receptor [Sphingomonas sp. CFBP 13720]|uniref:TonB-dependent siderophore receptor n=1 Tax=Sphingomonas sp. CFBP 13720 TaxID=2775302 RepID=UPI0017829A41|nr:TonB-dependent siderophore receptor [Sphingomonas sp. CFBP 13720]MBD8678094.1 TonB-dependent siderophore receptor [Sphingomonas sp. CFBP 13720]